MFEPAQKVWWLNMHGQILHVSIMYLYCYEYWKIDCGRLITDSERLIIVPEHELFSDQKEAYEEGINRLNKEKQ